MYKYSITQWTAGDEDIEQSFQRLSKYGYDGIEFQADPYAPDIDRWLLLMKEYGIKCYSLCGMFPENRDLTAPVADAEEAVQYLRDCVDLAVKTGASVIIICPSPVGRVVPPRGLNMDQLWENAIANIRSAADYAYEHCVKFAVESINRYETYFTNTLAKAYKLVKDINHPAVGIMADTFHMNIEENSLTRSIRMISDKLIHVHIADNTRGPAGVGTLDFRELLICLKDIEYNGTIAMEFMHRLANPYTALGMNTRTNTMDAYAEQAIRHMRMLEAALDVSE